MKSVATLVQICFGGPPKQPTQKQAEDTLEGLSLPGGLGTPWSPPGLGVGTEVAGEGGEREGCLGFPDETATPVTRDQAGDGEKKKTAEKK